MPDVNVNLTGTDDGLTNTVNAGTSALESYNAQLAQLAQQERAGQVLQAVKNDFAQLTNEEKEALITNQEYAQSMAAMQTEALGMNRAFDESHSTGNILSGTMTEINATMMVAQQVIGGVRQAYDATVGSTMAWGKEIRQVSFETGMSMEQTSSMVDLLDKFGVASSQVTLIQKTLAHEGLSLNIETLAKLADEYNALDGQVDKTNFLVKNFGRSGMDLADALSMGSAKLREYNSETGANMTLTLAQSNALKELEIQQKEVGDAWQGAINQLSMGLLPALTQVVGGVSAVINALGPYEELIIAIVSPITELVTLYGELTGKQESVSSGTEKVTKSMGGSTIALDQNAAAVTHSGTSLSHMTTETDKSTASTNKHIAAITGGNQSIAQYNASLGYAVSVTDGFTDAQKSAYTQTAQNGQKYVDIGKMISDAYLASGKSVSHFTETVTMSNGQITQSVDGVTSVIQQATQQQQGNWQDTSVSVGKAIEQLTGGVFGYINALGQIPGGVNTNITNQQGPLPNNSPLPPTGQQGMSAQVSGGGSSAPININISIPAGSYFERDTQLTASII